MIAHTRGFLGTWIYLRSTIRAYIVEAAVAVFAPLPSQHSLLYIYMFSGVLQENFRGIMGENQRRVKSRPEGGMQIQT
jgi:hypothetical protein